MITAIIPLIQVDINIFKATDDTLPVLDFYSTWALLIISGFFFTIGSYAFVRAFEEPPKPPLFTWKHVESDELLGAWLFFFGTAPAVPYTAIFYILNPGEIIYLGALAAAVLFVLATLLFVFACYPSEKALFSSSNPIYFSFSFRFLETSADDQTSCPHLLRPTPQDHQTHSERLVSRYLVFPLRLSDR